MSTEHRVARAFAVGTPGILPPLRPRGSRHGSGTVELGSGAVAGVEFPWSLPVAGTDVLDESSVAHEPVTRVYGTPGIV